jgi:hypothetical protein
MYDCGNFAREERTLKTARIPRRKFMDPLTTSSHTLFSSLQLRQLTSLLALILLTSVICLAQVVSGGLRVQVLDPMGNPVKAGITVKITNLDTNVELEQLTGPDGVASFLDLAPAEYKIEVDVRNLGTGFKGPVTVQSGITVEAQIELRRGPRARRSSSDRGRTIASITDSGSAEERETDPLNSLPNLNNDLSNILRQAPGASAGSPASLGKVVIDGKGKEQQTLRLDRLDVTPLSDLPAGDPALGVLDALLKPSVALQGSKTDMFQGVFAIKPSRINDEPTYELSPLYGPGTGVLIQGISIPGPYEKATDKWKITFYDTLRHDALNARNFFESEGKNDLRRNLFGVKLGLPINTQLFTFVAYDGIRGRIDRPVYEAVPVDAQCNCAQGPLAPFLGLFLPRGTTVMQGVSQNADFLTARRVLRSVSDADSFDARFDVARVQLSANTSLDSFYVRFTDHSARFLVPDGITGRRQKQSLSLASAVAGLTLLNGLNTRHQVTIGFNQNRSGIDIDSPYSTFPELSQSLITVGSTIPVKGLPGQLDIIPSTIPTASLGGLNKTIGRGFKQKPISFNASYDLRYLIGRDAIETGFEARFVNFTFDKFGGLTYAFSDVAKLRTGVADINFLSDLSEVAPFSSGLGPRHARQQNFLSYFQFTKAVSPDLTLRLGLRYDYFGPVSERDDRAIIIDPSTGQTVTDTKSFFKTDKFNFQPRIGIEYINSKRHLALRAGAGIYSGVPRIADLVLPIDSDRFNSGFKEGTFPFASSEIVRRFTSDEQNRQFQPLSFARDFKIPEKIYRWDGMLTRTFGDAWDLNLQYSGNLGRQLPVAGVANPIVSVETNQDPSQSAVVVRQFDTIKNGEVFKPLGELLFRSSAGRSSYNGLTIQFRRNRKKPSGEWNELDWRNFTNFNAQYTLSRNVGNASGAVVSVPNDFESDFGFNAADARHVFNFSTSYQFYNDKDRPQKGRWGWTIAPSITARSGFPLIIRLDRPDVVYVDSSGNLFGKPAVGRTALINTPGGGATGGARVPNLIPGADPFLRAGTIFLNPAAFAIPKPGEFGNLKRGQLRGPGAFQVDLAVTRTLFQTTKETKAFLGELKVEISNLLNRRNFANPPVTLPNALGISTTGDAIQPGVAFTRLAAGSFGVINAADPGRTIQFTLSLKFNEGY